MDFIIAPLITFIVFASIYGLFELFVRRRERLSLIEKLGDKLDPSYIEGKLNFSFLSGKASFGALKIACLMIGVGLGFLLGFIICVNCFPDYGNGWYETEVTGVIYGASLFICGGLGLLVAFLLEVKYLKKNK